MNKEEEKHWALIGEAHEIIKRYEQVIVENKNEIFAIRSRYKSNQEGDNGKE
jgi:hypothetical protein